MFNQCVQRDERRANLAPLVFSGSGEPVNEQYSARSLSHDREPRIQVSSENQMLPGSMGLKRPQGCRHMTYPLIVVLGIAATSAGLVDDQSALCSHRPTV